MVKDPKLEKTNQGELVADPFAQISISSLYILAEWYGADAESADAE